MLNLRNKLFLWRIPPSSLNHQTSIVSFFCFFWNRIILFITLFGNSFPSGSLLGYRRDKGFNFYANLICHFCLVPECDGLFFALFALFVFSNAQYNSASSLDMNSFCFFYYIRQIVYCYIMRETELKWIISNIFEWSLLDDMVEYGFVDMFESRLVIEYS